MKQTEQGRKSRRLRRIELDAKGSTVSWCLRHLPEGAPAHNRVCVWVVRDIPERIRLYGRKTLSTDRVTTALPRRTVLARHDIDCQVYTSVRVSTLLRPNVVDPLHRAVSVHRCRACTLILDMCCMIPPLTLVGLA